MGWMEKARKLFVCICVSISIDQTYHHQVSLLLLSSQILNFLTISRSFTLNFFCVGGILLMWNSASKSLKIFMKKILKLLQKFVLHPEKLATFGFFKAIFFTSAVCSFYCVKQFDGKTSPPPPPKKRKTLKGPRLNDSKNLKIHWQGRKFKKLWKAVNLIWKFQRKMFSDC